MPPPQFVDHLRAGVVLEAPQVLQTERADRLDLLVVAMRLEHDVGKDLQGWNQVAAERRRRQAGVQGLGTLGMADSQVIECREQFATVPRAGPARDPFGHHRGRATPDVHTVCDLVSRPGGDQQRERRRLDPGMTSPTSTSPLEYSCCSIVAGAVSGTMIPGSSGQMSVAVASGKWSVTENEHLLLAASPITHYCWKESD